MTCAALFVDDVTAGQPVAEDVLDGLGHPLHALARAQDVDPPSSDEVVDLRAGDRASRRGSKAGLSTMSRSPSTRMSCGRSRRGRRPATRFDDLQHGAPASDVAVAVSVSKFVMRIRYPPAVTITRLP